MPIHVIDYVWHQTETQVLLHLDLHHTDPKNINIVTSEMYIKVSFLPYIFEAFLSNAINADQSSARICNNRLEFVLIKEKKVSWEDFCLKLTHEEKSQKRQEAYADVEVRANEKLKCKKEDRMQRDRFAIGLQIEKDTQVREERMTKIKHEKEEFMKVAQIFDKSSEPLSSARRRSSSTGSAEAPMTSEGDYDGDGEESHYYSSTENLHGKGKDEKTKNAGKKQNRRCSSDRKGILERKSLAAEIPMDESEADMIMPPVRHSGRIQVSYTKRVFPTPSRESRMEEEEEWMASQNFGSAASVQESMCQEVDFLIKKSISLFESGDYRGCINACTKAIQTNPKIASFYSNRAAANLALNNLHHVINDCSKALELLTPPTDENCKSRLLCHIRRGTAFVSLGLYSEGLLDYRAARKLNPADENLLKDEQKIQAIMMASTDSCESDEDESEAEGNG